MCVDADGNERRRRGCLRAAERPAGNLRGGKFPVFEAADGRVVIPVTGMGLWGPVWGYIALEKDMNTVAGIIMAHKGETPGLGAEIATPKYQAQFRRQDDLRRRRVRLGDTAQGRRQGPRARGGCHFRRYEDLGRRDGDALQQPGELPAAARSQAQGRGSSRSYLLPCGMSLTKKT